MGVNSATDSSFAGWAEGAMGAAEAYVDAQAQAAADAQATARAEAEKGVYVPPNDGLEPTPAQSAQGSFWEHDPNRPGLGPNGSPPPSPTYLTDAEAQLLQKNGISVTTDEQGRQYVSNNDPERNIQVTQKPPPPSWALLPGSNDAPETGAPPQPPVDVPSDPSGAGGGPTEETGVAAKPVVPEQPAQKSPPIVSGLGEKVDALLNQSPTMRTLWEECQRRGIHLVIGSGPREEPSQWRPGKNEIYINLNGKGPDGDPNLKLASIMAHEMGHATGKQWGEPAGKNKEEYVRNGVAQFCDGEGEATFANAAARDEILANGGPDIGIRGGHDPHYLAVYEDYKQGRITAAEAKFRMGIVQGQEPTALTGDSPTRAQVAAEEWADAWDKKQAEKKP